MLIDALTGVNGEKLLLSSASKHRGANAALTRAEASAVMRLVTDVLLHVRL